MIRGLACAALGLSIACCTTLEPCARGAESAASVAEPTASAEELLRQAIDATLKGEVARRDELLSQAVAVNPEYAPARWHSGQVQFEEKWRTLEQVGQRVANDPRWQEYRQLRQSMANLPASHLELARWCMRKGLENEVRYHWTQVLMVDRTHELARARLGLREFRGGLYTDEQIADYQRRKDEARQNFDKFTPVFFELCRRVESNSADRKAALAELSRVSDSSAIAALEYVVQQESQNAPEDLALELNLAFISAVANVRNHRATLKLLDYSVFSPMPEVRQRAAASLKPRPVTDYVPLLLGALTAPIEAEIATLESPNGKVVNVQMFFQAGPESDRLLVRTHNYGLIAPANSEGRRGPVGLAMYANRSLASAQARQARAQVAMANAQAEARNERIRETLRTALELDYGSDAEAYWDEWCSYNELYEEEHPVYDYYEPYWYTFYVSPPAVRPPPVKYSCFAAGTPVWTQAGPEPIEMIAPGDIVLTQNPATGELAYRAVRQTTVRPPGRMACLHVGDETIVTTQGHRFWVLEKGWEMAKFLDETWLHALNGPEGVSLVEPSAPEQAYNLIVDDFHTYFVGEAGLLVHDNTCPRPTTAAIPGAAAPSK